MIKEIMAISDPISITVIITLVFTVLSFLIKDKTAEIYLKSLAGFCWFITATVYFIVNFATGAVTYALSVLFAGFGLIFTIIALKTFFGEKHRKIMGDE